MKIIHIVESLDKGAVENWLVRTFLESKKNNPNIVWHFYCILNSKGRLDNIVLENGGKIYYTDYPLSSKIGFLLSLRKVLLSEEYDIVHCHHDYLSGFYLLATIGIKFKKKIIHVHNTDKALPVGNKFLHYILLKIFYFNCLLFSDLIIGISENTLFEFVGYKRKLSTKCKVLYYGIDFTPNNLDANQFRTSLGIPYSDKIILFAGRLNYLKNPFFALEIFNKLLKIDCNYTLLLVGEGDLLNKLTDFVHEKKLYNKVKFLGWRSDLNSIMSISDVFLFPRIECPMEGLGLVVVEAQASSLPMLLSNGIPKDAIIINELANFLSIKQPVEVWAEKLYTISNTMKNKNYLNEMNNSVFYLPIATKKLIELYYL
jgi:glycosyltransferase involved in cell wall biosynthesis